VRVFADEGPPMAALLKRLIGARRRGQAAAASGPAREHLSRIVQAFTPAGPAAGAAPAVSGLIEPLSARELEVLSFIAAGRRNREIANELVVTSETVKKHTSHIFDKLGVANRTEAVTRARQLGLLP
jgi:LuxR family maltose regulon positive regulatory protein